MAELLLGIDVGTTGAKALLVDRAGRVAGNGVTEYPLATPQPLWAEQDAEDWWSALRTAVSAALAEAGDGEIKGVGLTGQMHGSVFLDADGRVIRPAILWCDQRTAEECLEIEERVPRLVEITLNPALTGFTAPKILWLRKHEPGNYARVAKVLLPKDFIRFRLTGQFATEVSDASGTSLFDVPKRDWSGEVLDALDIPRGWMAPAAESPEPTARVSAGGAAHSGIPGGVPVVGGGGDQAAGAVGVGIVREGLVSTSIGTSGVVFTVLDEPRMDPQLSAHTFCHAVPGKWHVMGVMLSAGGSLRWFRDVFCEEEKRAAREQGRDPYELITEAAAGVPPGCEGLVFLPYLSGERTPHKNPHARGVFFGATLKHAKSHFARAVLEGVAFGLNDSYGLLEAMGGRIAEVRASGGGARSAVWLQILADVTDRRHVRVAVDEGPAYGAALLAGVGIGWWPSVEAACDETVRLGARIEPSAENVPLYARTYETFRGLYRDLEGRFRAV
jgi:xylulokinase